MADITNVATNPYFSVDTAGWIANFGTISRTTDRAFAGPACGRLTTTSASAAYAQHTLTVPANQHIFIAYLWHELAGDRVFRLFQAGSALGSDTIIPGGEWTEISATFTGTGSAAGYRINLNTVTEAGESFHIGFMGIFEGTEAPDPLVPRIASDGTIIAPDVWNGTAHASTSTGPRPLPDTAPRPSRVLVLGSPHNIGPLKVGRR